MRWITCVQYILLLVNQASTYNVSSYFKYLPGFVWDDCMEPVSDTFLECAMRCGASNGCLGINLLEDDNGMSTCRLCYSSSSKSVSKVWSSFSQFMYFRFNTEKYQTARSEIYVLDLPNGLVEGQVFLLGTRIDFKDVKMDVLFLDSTPWLSAPRPEVDMMMQITLNYDARPYAIAFDNFDESSQIWSGPYIEKPLGDFLADGMEAYVAIFVNHLSYTVYLDGQLLCDYPRSQRKNLDEIKYVRMEGKWPYILAALH